MNYIYYIILYITSKVQSSCSTLGEIYISAKQHLYCYSLKWIMIHKKLQGHWAKI